MSRSFWDIVGGLPRQILTFLFTTLAYHEADLYVSQEDECYQEDTAEAQADISPELYVDDLISLPGEIYFVEGDSARQLTGAQ